MGQVKSWGIETIHKFKTKQASYLSNEGKWNTISAPDFPDCIKSTYDPDECQYKLGRMTLIYLNHEIHW